VVSLDFLLTNDVWPLGHVVQEQWLRMETMVGYECSWKAWESVKVTTVNGTKQCGFVRTTKSGKIVVSGTIK